MIELRQDQFLECEKLALGAFFPLSKFMNQAEFHSCVETLRLPSGEVFPLPVVFDLSQEEKDLYQDLNFIPLSFQGKHVANLHHEEFYKLGRQEVLKPLYGTTDEEHPGIQDFLSLKEYFASGRIELLERTQFEFSKYEMTPKETKDLFKKNNWKTIVGFQTRNIPHRAHEFLQKVALEIVDGLFIQPLVGKKKAGDFTPEAVLAGYNSLIENYYPENSVAFGVLSTKMRYAGPREAIFHALIRRNYGCTHFIVGRDHAGVGDYYGTYEAHRLIETVEAELGITILKLHGPYYCNKCLGVVTEKTCPHSETSFREDISGTKIRKMISEKAEIEEHLIRKEVIESVIELNAFIS